MPDFLHAVAKNWSRPRLSAGLAACGLASLANKKAKKMRGGTAQVPLRLFRSPPRLDEQETSLAERVAERVA